MIKNVSDQLTDIRTDAFERDTYTLCVVKGDCRVALPALPLRLETRPRSTRR